MTRGTKYTLQGSTPSQARPTKVTKLPSNIQTIGKIVRPDKQYREKLAIAAKQNQRQCPKNTNSGCPKISGKPTSENK
jgi:hypothetical protein